MVGNSTQEIVDNIILLYQNREVWEKVSLNSKNVIEPFSTSAIEQKILSLVK